MVQIDNAAIDALTSLQQPGKPDLFAKIFSMFELNTPGLLESIEAGYATGDSEAVRTAAHSLKSSAAYVGASELSEICKVIEVAAREEQLEQAQEQVGRISDVYVQTLDALQPYLHKAA